MTTTTTEMPDGERLARVEIRVEHLEGQAAEIREDIREIRTHIRDVRSKIDRNLLWILGVIITMWLSLVAMWITTMLTVVNKLGG